MDFTTPALGTPGGNQQALLNDVSNLAPLATQWHGASSGVNIGQIMNTPSAGSSPGVIKGVENWVGSVGHSIGGLAVHAAAWLGKTAVTDSYRTIHLGADIGHGIVDYSKTLNIQDQNNQLSGRFDTLQGLLKSGSINSSEYLAELKQLNQDMDNNVRAATANTNLTQSHANQANTDAITAASTIVTILTAGIGSAAGLAGTEVGAQTAAQWLASDAADAATFKVAARMSQLLTTDGALEGVPFGARYAMQRSAAEVLTQAAPHLTAEQIGRAMATNMLVKYPIYTNYMSSTAEGILKELDSHNYKGAVAQFAFNAGMAASGGPIGWALKQLGTGTRGVLGAIFERTPYIDELSKGLKGGDPAGIFNAVNNIQNADEFKFWDPASKSFVTKSEGDIQKAIVKNLSASEATNLNAVGGKNVTAAAWRVINGMQAYIGASLDTMTPHEFLVNTNNFFEAQRMLDDLGDRMGLGKITAGRIDSRSLAGIGKVLGGIRGAGADAAHSAWEQLKVDNPSWAWAHNENFDKQIHALIDLHSDGNQLQQSITDIKASFSLKNVPKAISEELASIGYVAIKPSNLEAPFREGTGKVATKFTESPNYLFIKAVQPLPILGHLGALLTAGGLSPYASSQRVYALFNSNVAANLAETGAMRKIAGAMNDTELRKASLKMELNKLADTGAGEAESKAAVRTVEDASDSALKIISDYARKPTKGFVGSKFVAVDFRQLSRGDIVRAFADKGMTITREDAHQMQNAIEKAYLQVPRAVRGLGDRLVDRTYQLPVAGAVFGRYMRLMGGLRFTWNPFFAYLRVIPKTEFLATAKGGGYISAVFAGQGKQIAEIRQTLRDAGFLDAKGRIGNVLSAEAHDLGQGTAANLGKRLLPGQEASIAGLIASQAQRLGMDYKTYIKMHPENVRDTIQSIAEYSRHSDFLNSPLARTLNIAIFPFRFDAKVLSIMAKGISETSPLTQIAVVNGLYKAHDFLNSPEGIQWYSQNADMIGLFKYISPIASLNEVFHALVPGNDHSLGNFGEIGGLPFGWIPAILDAEGKTHFNQVGADPKTGALYENYIPVTAKGQVAIAIQDFIGTLFSYPGAQVGLPSKGSLTRQMALGITQGNKKTDLKLTTPPASEMTAQQAHYQDVLQTIANNKPGAVNQANVAIPNSTNNVPSQLSPSTSVPQLPTPALTPLPRTTGKSGGKKLKEKQFTPQLAPGQTSFGQL